jgi:hypothetical protein
MPKSFLTTFFITFALTVHAHAAVVFVDTFSNGTPENSDTEVGFWTTSTAAAGGSANAITESGGTLTLSAGDNDGTNDSANSGVLLVSDVSADFNFFEQELTFQVRGISFSGTSPTGKRRLRFGLTSTAQNSFAAPDAVVVAVDGDGFVKLGRKADRPNQTTGIAIFDDSTGVDNSITGFDLTLSQGAGENINYRLATFGSDPLVKSSTFNLQRSEWGTNGDSALMLWAQENADVGDNNNFSVTVSSLSVIPEPNAGALLGAIALAWAGLARRRRW